MTRRSVLIADDNAEWRAVIARVFEPDFEILDFIENGSNVVDRALALRPDVITLDISMPGVSGLNLLPNLRAALPHAVIVIVTTTTSKVYVEEAYQRGADGYVRKSRLLHDLLPAVQAPRLRDGLRQTL